MDKVTKRDKQKENLKRVAKLNHQKICVDVKTNSKETTHSHQKR